MAAFLSQTNLSKRDLKLCLTNSNGYSQDAFSVRWTVYDLTGARVSGKSLPAIRKSVGQYYAPWFSDVANGNYKITWEIKETYSSATINKTEEFFVIDPSSYSTKFPLKPSSIPISGHFTYLSGTQLGSNDLPLFTKNDAGLPQNAFSVFWSIYDAANNLVVSKTFGMSTVVGHYYAPWFVNVSSGNYIIQWDFQKDASSPTESFRYGFTIIDPSFVFADSALVDCPILFDTQCSTTPLLFSRVITSPCQPVSSGCGCSSTSLFLSPSTGSGTGGSGGTTTNISPNLAQQCCNFEVPIVAHLVEQVLPAGGVDTSQSAFLIPAGVRHLAFYITYKRGGAGGFGKLNLYWNNGQQEYHGTLLSSDTSLTDLTSSQGLFQQDLFGPTPLDDNPITFILEVSPPGGAKAVRVTISERGNIAFPGTASITLTAST